MTGDEFRENIGEYAKVWNDDLQKYEVQFKNWDNFLELKQRLRVIARATPEDKFLLIAGIKEAGGLVAMTGESVADATALKEADVGLCMGSGCQVAKDNSDLVILDNNFSSIHRSIKWGRQIFNNVRKFLQFQMTINVVLCLYVFIMALAIGSSPLNVIQLLWANLIMDVLAAISICTEPPSRDVYKKLKVENQQENEEDNDEEGSKKEDVLIEFEERISRSNYRTITLGMWRTILGQAFYQLFVLLFLTFFGTLIFYDESYNIVSAPLLDGKFHPSDRMKNNTLVFHTFILMNLFNQINCRVVSDTEMNVFKTLFNNPIFWLITALEVAITEYMIFAAYLPLGPILIGSAPLT